MKAGQGSAARWLLAYTSAVAGDVMYFVVLSWAAAEAGGPLTSGLILAAGAIPRALLMLPGGVFADRVNPRRLVIGSDGLRCLVMLAAAGLGALLGVLPGWLAVVAVVFGIVDAFFLPAVGAMPAHLVPQDQLKRLQAWRITGLRVSNTVGPAAGAVLITVGVPAAFAAIAALFAISVALLITVKLRQPRSSAQPVAAAGFGIRPTLSQLREHHLRSLILATALSELPFSGPVAVGIVLLVQERHWSAEAAGGVLSAFSIGGLAATLACTVLPKRVMGKTTVLVSMGVTTVFLGALAVASTPWSALAIGTVLGVATGFTMVICHGQIQQSTPVELLGRVTAILTLLTLGAGPLLYAAAGVVAATLGIEVFFVGAAFIALVAAVIMATARV